jgi:hypothetical protein
MALIKSEITHKLLQPREADAPEEIWYEELFTIKPEPKDAVAWYNFFDQYETDPVECQKPHGPKEGRYRVELSRRDFRKCSLTRLNELLKECTGDIRARVIELITRVESLPQGCYVKRSSIPLPDAASRFWLEDENDDDALMRLVKALAHEAGLLYRGIKAGTVVSTSIGLDPGIRGKARIKSPRKRTPDEQLAVTKELIKQMKKERLTHKAMCARLGDHPRPQQSRWKDLTWPIAYRKHTSSVKKWLSQASR